MSRAGPLAPGAAGTCFAKAIRSTKVDGYHAGPTPPSAPRTIGGYVGPGVPVSRIWRPSTASRTPSGAHDTPPPDLWTIVGHSPRAPSSVSDPGVRTSLGALTASRDPSGLAATNL